MVCLDNFSALFREFKNVEKLCFEPQNKMEVSGQIHASISLCVCVLYFNEAASS
jgi:hypothetical protein